MNIKSIFTIETNIDRAVNDITAQLKGFDTKLLVFFASSSFNPQELSQVLGESFSNSNVIGCTTAGEFCSTKALKNSIVAMAFSSETILDLSVDVVRGLSKGVDVGESFYAFEKHFGEPMSQMDARKHVGLVLVDGLSACEERLMDKIGDKTNVTFIGGSAGDDLKFERTHVFVNGKAFTDAAVLALIKPSAQFDFIKTQSFSRLDRKLVATKVNEETREVIEFNNKPAVQAYAEALNVNVNEVSQYFMSNPVGLVVDDEIYVRSPQKVVGQNVKFYCNILEGMEVWLLQTSDIVRDTKQAIKNKEMELGNISGIINFHCILRTLELEKEEKMQEYARVFENIPTIGFSTYGEEFIGHINQTSTMLVFK